MSTRSLIGILNSDGTVNYIYCNWDGYIEHVGKILIKHYKTEDHIRKLIALGDLSSLHERKLLAIRDLSSLQEFFAEEDKEAGYDAEICVSYSRDLKEENEAPHTAKTVYDYAVVDARKIGVDYVYLFQDGRWTYDEPKHAHGLIPVPETLKERN